MTTSDQSEGIIRWEIAISADRDHFFRRTCPSCGRDFKTEVDQADLSLLLNYQIRRSGVEIGEAPGDGGGNAETYIFCPYCKHQGEASEMNTEEFKKYVKRIIFREYVSPMVGNLFDGFRDSLERLNRPGGALSFSVDRSQELRAPKPMHGPEPPDMTIVHFLCCGKSSKVADSYHDLCICPYCGIEVALS